jgi:phenylalanyl-tRNA synthetase beta chain
LPVIQLSLARLGQFCKQKASERTIFENLPYLGLDIEDHEGDVVSVEYSPNRPDFSSEAGIARSLVGLLGIETGIPKYSFPRSKFTIAVAGPEIKSVRPFIRALSAQILVTEDLIKQLITMQEDLHNGVGRHRSKVAIGIHNASVIADELKYYAVEDEESISFAPLGLTKKKTIREIITETDQGIAYGRLLSGKFPILEDSKGNVLSMPPIINGELTRLKSGVSEILVDITGTDERAVDVSIAIVASMLADVGAHVSSVLISSGEKDDNSILSPDMTPSRTMFDLKLANDTLGFDLTLDEAKIALEKSRIGLDASGYALIPRFRNDVLHSVDLAEEVALGFGIAKITPLSFSSSLVGGFEPRLRKLDSVIDVLIGLGLIDIWNLSLTSAEQVAHCNGSLKVTEAKSQSFEYLRCDIMPSLLQVLGASTHQEYPQKIFEMAPVFARSSGSASGVIEEEHVAAALADSEASYSNVRSVVDAFLRLVLGADAQISFVPEEDYHSNFFAKGRTASVRVHDPRTETHVGIVGEIDPAVLEKYGLGVPVVGFELNLERLIFPKD